MHLVFLNQYYPPDAAPTGVMLQAVAEELAAQGHQVTVICAEGGYADVGHPTSKVEYRTSKGGDVAVVHVLRIRATRFGRGTFVGKVVDYLSYYVGVAWNLMWLRPRPERIVALTTPPYLSVLARLFSKLRGGDHAHWVMDLYPDVMVAHGMLREGGAAHRLLAGLARWGFGGKRCATLLTLGPDMAERVEGLKVGNVAAVRDRRGEWGGEGSSGPVWVPLWSDAEGERRTSSDDEDSTAVANCGRGFRTSQSRHVAALHCRHARGWRDDELVVMYSGNMGLGHRFGEILEVIESESGMRRPLVAAVYDRQRECGEDDPAIAGPAARDEVGRPRPVVPTRFVFFGGGKRRGEIERFVAEHPEAAVELHDYAPAEDLGIHLRSADVHLASLAAEWTGTMVPSKLQGIFHAARPVIFIGDANSSIGRWVAESGGGWVVAPGDVEGLRRALEEAREPDARESRGRAAKAFAEANFDKQANVRRVVEALAG